MLPKLKKTDFKLLSYLLENLSLNSDYEDRSAYDSEDISRDIITYGGTATLKKIKLEKQKLKDSSIDLDDSDDDCEIGDDIVDLTDLKNYYKSMFDEVSKTKAKDVDSNDTSIVKAEHSDKFVTLKYRGEVPNTNILNIDITSISKQESVGTIRDINTNDKTVRIQLYETENIFMQLITEIENYSIEENYYIHFNNSVPMIKVLY